MPFARNADSKNMAATSQPAAPPLNSVSVPKDWQSSERCNSESVKFWQHIIQTLWAHLKASRTAASPMGFEWPMAGLLARPWLLVIYFAIISQQN